MVDLKNLHPYAASNLAAEYALFHEANKNSIEGISLRISNGFGVPQDPKNNCWIFLTNDLCRQAVTKGKLQLLTSGEQKRDFIPLSAIVEHISKIMSFTSEKLPITINIGSEQSISVMEKALLIQQRCKDLLNELPPIEVGKKRETGNKLQDRTLYVDNLNDNQLQLYESIDETIVFCIKYIN